MKRTALPVALIALAFLAVVPPGPAHADRALSLRFASNGITTVASSGDLPPGDLVAGTTYHTWYVIAGSNIADGSGHTSVPFVQYFEDVFTVTESGDYVPIDGFLGTLYGAGVTYTVDQALTSAHVQAVVPGEACDEVACTPTGEERTVDVTWTGTGPLVHEATSFRFGGTSLLADYHSEGSHRSASVSGIPEPVTDASFFSGRTAFHFVLKL